MIALVDTSWLSTILGAGGVSFLYALYKGFTLLRDSAASREKKAIAGLEKWRLDADQRTDDALGDLAYERTLSAYWQVRAGALEYLIASRLGPDSVPVAGPLPIRPPRPAEKEAARE